MAVLPVTQALRWHPRAGLPKLLRPLSWSVRAWSPMSAPKFALAGTAITLACLLAGCSTSSTVPSRHPATQQEKDRLGAHVVSDPKGWTSQAPITRIAVNSVIDCTGSGLGPSGWLASEVRAWRQSPTAPAPGAEPDPSLQVCLSLYVTPTDATSVQSQNASQMHAAEHPQGSPPSSVPVPVTVPGVPGAVGSFLDISTAGWESIFFACGNVVAWIYVLCDPGGGPSCAIGISTAQRQYHKLPG
jgi:hypothetical protein